MDCRFLWWQRNRCYGNGLNTWDYTYVHSVARPQSLCKCLTASPLVNQGRNANKTNICTVIPPEITKNTPLCIYILMYFTNIWHIISLRTSLCSFERHLLCTLISYTLTESGGNRAVNDSWHKVLDINMSLSKAVIRTWSRHLCQRQQVQWCCVNLEVAPLIVPHRKATSVYSRQDSTARRHHQANSADNWTVYTTHLQ